MHEADWVFTFITAALLTGCVYALGYHRALLVERGRWHSAIRKRIDWLREEKLTFGQFPYAALDLVFYSTTSRWGEAEVNSGVGLEYAKHRAPKG